MQYKLSTSSLWILYLLLNILRTNKGDISCTNIFCRYCLYMIFVRGQGFFYLITLIYIVQVQNSILFFKVMFWNSRLKQKIRRIKNEFRHDKPPQICQIYFFIFIYIYLYKNINLFLQLLLESNSLSTCTSCMYE